MNKINGIIIILSFMLGACQNGKLVIHGEIENLQYNKMYLCEVENEYRGVHRVVDSATVTDGKFQFILENTKPELYFIGIDRFHGGYVFVDGRKINISPSAVDGEKIDWQVSGSSLDDKYRAFEKEKYHVREQAVLDSLDRLFYQARKIRDTARMRQIKELSKPYYENAGLKEMELVSFTIDANKGNVFGIYLYYSKKFQHKDFPTSESIMTEKEYVNSFGESVKESRYMQEIFKQLEVYENCAVGHIAPEISGIDTLGNLMKLSDLQGKYVIVDFWNSYCKWCRLETPWLRKAEKYFAGKDFIILGVSSDYYKDKWIEAIHEDESYWTHILVDRKDQEAMFNAYCIKGIPHIILIGPDGKILAKDLRGDDITAITAKYIK